MHEHPSTRTLRIIGLSFVPVIIGGAVVIIALQGGWTEGDDALARTGSWVAGALGAVGIIAAAVWRNLITAGPVSAGRLVTSFFITGAIAESSMLAGFVFAVLAENGRPFFIGLGLFAVALAIMVLSLSQTEVEADGSPAGLIR